MMEWLINKYRGYVRVAVEGDFSERFFNLVNARGIHIWDICKLEKGIEFYIHVYNVSRLKGILKKTKMKLKVKERYGLPFFLHKNRKRKMLFLGLISGWFIVYTMSLYVWNISFIGNVSHTDDELTKFMEAMGIKEGIKQSEIEPEEIEKAIRNQYFDITWASVEVSGTMLRVHIRENNNYKEDEKNVDSIDNEIGDVISSKNATIVSIVTRSGTPLVKEGDVVGKGDKLIEGRYVVYGDDLSIISEHQVKAEGDIIGNVIYDVSEVIDRKYVKKVYTGNEYKIDKFSYNLDTLNISLPWQVKDYKLYDTITTGRNLVLGNDFYLPLYVGSTIYKEYVISDEKYTDDELKKLANEKIAYILKKIEKNTIQILDNNVRIEISEENCTILGQIVVLEYIGTFGGTYE